ncbi:helix-turn-helix domain-containing protein [Paenibacillus sp. HJGM_3]|uniref:AraC family transcriptional regulator n=1 Tax=Paenibacillus sp. HJGM_3 TaxID=3379816 RepID=UPI003859D0B2
MPRSLRFNRRSLFSKLLLGFMIIILVSFAFNGWAYRFFHRQMIDQLVHSSTLGLANKVDGYEKQLSQIDDLLTMHFFDASLMSLKKSSFDSNFPRVNELADQFRAITIKYNSSVENAFIYYKGQNFVIDKNGYSSAEDMFGKYYISPGYGPEFWAAQFREDFHLKVLPAAQFKRSPLDSFQESKSSRYMPVIVRNQIGSPFYMAALVDTERMFGSLSGSGASEGFYITDSNGSLYFGSGAMPEGALPALQTDRSHMLYDNNYYFYQKGPVSGLTYVSIVPYEAIASQLDRMSALLLTLFGLSILVSIAISVLLSVRFKNPVQRIIEGLREMNPVIPHRSKVYEFNVISESMQHIIASLHRKDSLLQKYSYLDQIKSIHSLDTELQGRVETERPFHFLMFQVHGLLKAHPLLESINRNVMEAFPDSMTIQIEKNRILSIIFAEQDISPAIMNMLDGLKLQLDQDRTYGQVTIAFQTRLWEPAQFTAAYEAASEMIRQRKLRAETQIVTQPGSGPALALWIPEDERTLAAHLDVGNAEPLRTFVQTKLQWLGKQEAAAWQYAQFAGDLLSKLLMALMAHKIDTGLLQPEGEPSPFDTMESLMEPEEYEAFLGNMVERAAALIRDKREANDPIVDFVIRFIEQHYGDDIYQELIADRLNISTGYLRHYFKDKTGRHMSDYLNEYRMGKAKELLADTEERIQDIAAKVGYQNANSFTRMFRRLTGVTPGEYRRDRRMVN